MTTITVTSLLDPTTAGKLTLREAVAAAAANDVIVFDPPLRGGTILLDGHSIQIHNSVSIIGDGITINAGGMSGVILIAAGCTVSLVELTIEDGYEMTSGGGIYNNGLLTVKDCTIHGNEANRGGGISSYGSLTVIGGHIVDNRANEGGGVWQASGGITEVYGTLIARNVATGRGGGVWMNSTSATPTLKMYNATVAGNTAATGGGIGNNNVVELYNTLVAKNTAADSNDLWTRNAADSLTRVYNSLVGDTKTTTGKQPVNAGGSMLGSATPIDPLFTNAAGGNYTLMETSPAINRGRNMYVPEWMTTDLAGRARIVDDTVDVGAYEFDPTPPDPPDPPSDSSLIDEFSDWEKLWSDSELLIATTLGSCPAALRNMEVPK